MQATSLQIVFNRYIQAISKQMTEFYGRAAQQIEILINQGEPCQPAQ